MELYITGITLEVPKGALAADTLVKLSILDPSAAPEFHTDVGEAVLGSIVKVGPAKLKFNVPAILSIPYSIVDIPKHTSICISYLDGDAKKLQGRSIIPGAYTSSLINSLTLFMNISHLRRQLGTSTPFITTVESKKASLVMASPPHE